MFDVNFYDITNLEFSRLRDWCADQFGPVERFIATESKCDRWYWYRVGNDCIIRFENKDDLTMFWLTWESEYSRCMQ